MLTKDQIISADDLLYEDVEIEEWGGSVRVRRMTGAERDAFDASIYEIKGKDVKVNRENYRSKLLVKVLVDENNTRLFSDKEIGELGKKSVQALDKLFVVAQKVNGLSPDIQEAFVKNLEGEENDILNSPSPES